VINDRHIGSHPAGKYATSPYQTQPIKKPQPSQVEVFIGDGIAKLFTQSTHQYRYIVLIASIKNISDSDAI
jgi:hypothetical protein